MAGIENVRAALETALNGMSPALNTVWENGDFTPTTDTAYQRVHILFASPDNAQYGDTYQEIGYMQVDLMYPLGVGTLDVNARAELLRATFTRGNSFTSSGVVTIIQKTPEVMPGRAEEDRWVVSVVIRFYANIGV